MPFFRRSYGSISLVLVAAGFVLLAVIVFASLWIADRAREQNQSVAETQEMVSAAYRLISLLERAELSRRGLLITGEERFAEVASTAVREAEAPLSVLRNAGVGAMGQTFAQIETLIDRRLDNIVQSVALVRDGRREAAIGGFATDAGVEDLMALRQTLGSMVEAQSASLALGIAAANRNIRNFVLVTILSVIVLLGLALASVVLLRRYTGEIAASRAQLGELNASLEEAVTERTADLLAANAEIQRFAYIVSHDLRAPLVNIMGFTSELEAGQASVRSAIDAVAEAAPDSVSPEVREIVDKDWPESIGFIRSATEKMDRLINAILKLSREGRRIFAPQRLDMTEILTGVADAVRHQAIEIGAEIHVDPLPEIVSDRLAVEQVFGNLVDNAVKYLAPNRPGVIRISGRAAGRLVEFSVTDNGRGIAEQDMDRIFDLFRRSGVQDRPGEGIGLAHVRSLVRRLGGTISCSSTLGAGTEFKVVLPRVMKREERGSQ